MPPVTTNAAPSTLPDVLRQIIDVFSAVGDAMPVQIGKQYLDNFGIGDGPKVLFVPHVKGEAMPPIEMGSAMSLSAGCDVLVRGAEDGSDLGRYDSALAILARVGDYIGTACIGRVTWGEFEDDSPLAVDAYGADLAVSFKYRYDVRHDPSRWALAPAALDTSPPFSPTAPQAMPADEPTFTGTVTPQEPS